MKRKIFWELVKRFIIRNPLKVIFILAFIILLTFLSPSMGLASSLKWSLLFAILLVIAVVVLTFVIVCTIVFIQNILDDLKKEIREIEEQNKDQFWQSFLFAPHSILMLWGFKIISKKSCTCN